MYNEGKDIAEYTLLHKKHKDFGTSSTMYFETICLFIDYLRPSTILDYGCGKGMLIDALKKRYKDISIYGYDPAIEGINTLPKGIDHYDFIINTDVLEHVPEEEFDNLLNTIRNLSENVFFGLHHTLAEATLSDGRNAHCTTKDKLWYYEKINQFFDNVFVLEGEFSYLSTIITFNTGGEVWENYHNIIQRKKLIRTLISSDYPIFKIFKILIRPFYRFLYKRQS